jgi:predicted short-subunit dehydrogenase-like oxidoreductase (DUF2520 family)
MIKVSKLCETRVAQPISAFISVQKIEFKIELVKAYTRKRGHFLLDNSQICTDIQQLKEADLYIIMAVSDDAIASLSEQLTFKNKLVVHTSGGVSVDVINDSNRKVFFIRYKLYENKTVDFNTIPICLEAKCNRLLLDTVAKLITF